MKELLNKYKGKIKLQDEIIKGNKEQINNYKTREGQGAILGLIHAEEDIKNQKIERRCYVQFVSDLENLNH